jgi:hypothetical protein
MAKPLFHHVVGRALAYVGDRSCWTRYTLALTGNNRDCEPTDPKAARFCAFGALVRAAHDMTGDARRAERLAGRAAMWITDKDTPGKAYAAIYGINDGPRQTSHRAIVQLLERSLERV